MSHGHMKFLMKSYLIFRQKLCKWHIKSYSVDSKGRNVTLREKKADILTKQKKAMSEESGVEFVKAYHLICD